MLIKYREIFKLMYLLDVNKIKYEFYDRSQENAYGKGNHFIHFQIINKKNTSERAFSIIEGFGTYGSEDDKLEVMNYFEADSEDHVLGYLSADEVLAIVNKNITYI